ncbi:MAG: hypothetical protein WC052_04345 [Patescibacteria group bacterium]
MNYDTESEWTEFSAKIDALAAIQTEAIKANPDEFSAKINALAAAAKVSATTADEIEESLAEESANAPRKKKLTIIDYTIQYCLDLNASRNSKRTLAILKNGTIVELDLKQHKGELPRDTSIRSTKSLDRARCAWEKQKQMKCDLGECMRCAMTTVNNHVTKTRQKPYIVSTLTKAAEVEYRSEGLRYWGDLFVMTKGNKGEYAVSIVGILRGNMEGDTLEIRSHLQSRYIDDMGAPEIVAIVWLDGIVSELSPDETTYSWSSSDEEMVFRPSKNCPKPVPL